MRGAVTALDPGGSDVRRIRRLPSRPEIGYSGPRYPVCDPMSGIVKFSEAASLALHAMTVLAARADPHLTIRDVAEAMPVSEAYLAKVLQRLAKAGLVESVRGPGGGFRIRGDPRQITLLAVYEAIEGRLGIAACAFPVAQGCKTCILDEALRDANRLVHDRLARTTLADLDGTFRPNPLVTLGGPARTAAARSRRQS